MPMVALCLWVLLAFVCWPLALALLVLYPLVWLVLLPFRIAGLAIGSVLGLVAALLSLPARLIRAI